MSRPPPLCKSKKMKTKTSSHALPKEIVAYSILPRLPFKSIRRFTSVCKNWNNLISGVNEDPLFASLLGPSYCSIARGRISPDAGVITVDQHGLIQFLPTLAKSPADILAAFPLKDLVAKDCLTNVWTFRIEASTNGLVCFRCTGRRGGYSLYLCNPATKEPGHHVPIPFDYDGRSGVGLAVIPTTTISPADSLDSTSYSSYILALPVQDGAVYRFKVFSSLRPSGGWTYSDQVLAVRGDRFHPPVKSLSTRRRLYWYCYEYLIYFHYHKDNKPFVAAGHIRMPPWDPRSDPCRNQDIGVCGDLVTLVQLSTDGFYVWMLYHNTNDGDNKYWGQIYRVDLECIVVSNDPVFSKLLHGAKRLRRHRGKAFGNIFTDRMHPFPYEGGRKVLFKWAINNSESVLLSFDMKSGKMTEIVSGLLFGCQQLPSFGHTKSLIPMLN